MKITSILVFILILITGCNKTGKQAIDEKNEDANVHIYDDESDFKTRFFDGGMTVEITGYAGSKTEVRIPPQIGKFRVTRIGDRAFSANRLTSVTIPSGVTRIGDRAFYRSRLTSVIIPSGVTSIGYCAFDGNQLTSVTIPDSVTSIGERAFSWNQLTSVIIPDSVTSIGKEAFANNPLAGVTIPERVPIHKQENLNKIMYVNSPEGLRVRASPSINGDRIGLLDHLTEVRIIREDNDIVIIEGIEGKWVFIISPVGGWVFSGFLEDDEQYINRLSETNYDDESDTEGGFN
jgi:hypothetical protein